MLYTDEFSDGALRSSAMFYSVQQDQRAGYRPSSVLEPTTHSSIGYSASDSRRILPGGRMLPSPNGQSDETYMRRAYIGAV